MYSTFFLSLSEVVSSKYLCLNSDVSLYNGSHVSSSLFLTYFWASLIAPENGCCGILPFCILPLALITLFTNEKVKLSYNRIIIPLIVVLWLLDFVDPKNIVG